jgi:predicted nuclease of predicted toxin-antitoxin system
VNLVADESVHAAIIDRLRADGHTLRAIRDTNGGAADPDVLAVAVNEQAVLLTQDKDFGELVYRLGLDHCGIVLIRLAGIGVSIRADVVSGVIRDHATELTGAFTVISSGGVRIRRPTSPA